MADQGRWFKLWISALSDPDLRNLSLEDFGRWCAFGAYLKLHGDEGRLTVKVPAVALQELFRVPSFEAVCKVLDAFPNCRVNTPRVTGQIPLHMKVEWLNWQKYQVDDSSDRVRRWREKQRGLVTTENVPPVTPIEEKRSRRDEKRLNPPVVPPGGPELEILNWLNHKAGKNFRPKETNLAFIRGRLADGIQSWQLKAIVSRKTREWVGTERATFLRPQTLFNKTKCEQYLGELPSNGDAD